MEQFFDPSQQAQGTDGKPILDDSMFFPGPVDIKQGGKVIGQVTDINVTWLAPGTTKGFRPLPKGQASFDLQWISKEDTPYIVALRAAIDRHTLVYSGRRVPKAELQRVARLRAFLRRAQGM